MARSSDKGKMVGMETLLVTMVAQLKYILITWFPILLLLLLPMMTSACPNNRECYCESSNRQTIINCRRQDLSEIPTFQSENTLYYELTLAHNKIPALTSGAFQGIRFEKLDLSENKITTISPSAFSGIEPYLKELILDVENLNTFPTDALSGLVNLERLTIKNFQFSSLSSNALSTLVKLQELSIIDCGLVYIYSSDLSAQKDSLKSLVLTTNNIANIPKDLLRTLTKLETLYLNHNKITTIASNSFTQNTMLRELDISSNNLNNIQQNAFSGLENSLQTLSLNTNQLTRNQITPIGDLSSLLQLNLGYNQLDNIPLGAFDTLSSLDQLNLHGNKITNLQIETFQGIASTLKILMLYENQIASIESGFFQFFSSLQDLNLGGQNIGSLLTPTLFAGLEDTLLHLYLDQTGATSAVWNAVSYLTSLNKLSLSKNSINSISDNVFLEMSALANLDLSDNGLSMITQKKMHGLQKSLVSLNLQNNNLATLDECSLFEFEAITNIDLLYNPLSCDCGLKWLVRWGRMDGNQVNGICASPDSLKDQLLQFLVEEQLVCNPPVDPVTCSPITTTTTTTTTVAPPSSSTSPTASSTTYSSTTTALEPMLLNVTNVTHASCILSWYIYPSETILSFTIEYRKFGGDNYIDVISLQRDARKYELEELEPVTSYIVCITKHANYGNQVRDDVSCSDVVTTEIPSATSAVKSGLDGSVLAGIIVAVIIVILIIALACFFIIHRRKNGKSLYEMPWRKKPKGQLPTRADMPQMGYNSKRFSRPKPESMDVQNAMNKKMELKLDGFTPEERDRILNMLTTSATSTTSIISNASSQRYIPELPPRNPNMGGYLNPVSIHDEDDNPEEHIYMEIDSQNPPGAVGGSIPTVSYQTEKAKNYYQPCNNEISQNDKTRKTNPYVKAKAMVAGGQPKTESPKPHYEESHI